MSDKKRAERTQLEVFIRLFNNRYSTDYVFSSPGSENSIVDGRAISQSGEHPEIIIQLKDIKEFDNSEFTKSIMGSGVKVFDLNIFKLLTPQLEKIEKKYGVGANNIVLVLNVGVSEEWMKDYRAPENFIEQTKFQAIYCLGLPSSIASKGYIFPLKEISLIGPEVIFLSGE